MEHNLQIIDPTEFPNWDELIKDKTDYAFFNSSLWANVLKQTYAFKAYYLSIVENNEIQFLLPLMDVKSWLTSKRVVSLPFTDFCFPIFNNNNYKSFFEKIINTCTSKKWQTIEFRSNNLVPENHLFASTYYDHKIDLDSQIDILFHQLKSSTKRNIKKAERSGIEVKICDSYKSVIDYYKLHCKTRKKHGVPPQPFNFFRNIFKFVIAKGYGKIFLAYYTNKVIAGAIYFQFGDQVIYKFGASDKKYQLLRANNLVMWEAIRYYNIDGFKTLFLGRTDIDNNGLRRFKKDMNAEERTVDYYIFDIKNNEFLKANQISKKYYNILNKMPIVLLKLIGLIIYKHTG